MHSCRRRQRLTGKARGGTNVTATGRRSRQPRVSRLLTSMRITIRIDNNLPDGQVNATPSATGYRRVLTVGPFASSDEMSTAQEFGGTLSPVIADKPDGATTLK